MTYEEERIYRLIDENNRLRIKLGEQDRLLAMQDVLIDKHNAFNLAIGATPEMTKENLERLVYGTVCKSDLTPVAPALRWLIEMLVEEREAITPTCNSDHQTNAVYDDVIGLLKRGLNVLDMRITEGGWSAKSNLP